jgi:PST family polysaccharide transporter
MGFIVVAKGQQAVYFWTEVAATLVHVGLAWWLVTWWGLEGSGLAFFGLYVWHGLLIYVIVRQTAGFRWSAANKRLGLVFLPVMGLVFLGFYWLPHWVATTVGVVAVGLSSAYSVRTLLKLLPVESIPAPLRSWVARRRGLRASSSYSKPDVQ